MKLPLAYYGNPVLRRKAKEVEEITDEIREIVAGMKETIVASNGIGLAATQVSKEVRIFLVRPYEVGPEGEAIWQEIMVFINPKLSSPSEEECFMGEGCLSIPTIYAEVSRPESIEVEAIDLEGNPFKERFSGQLARIIMHENDHLNGVLFIDRLPPSERKALDQPLRKIKKKYRQK